MNPTSRAILQTVFATDASLTGSERDVVQRLIAGQTEAAPVASISGEKLLITQKQAAELLSVNRVTIWRMTKDCLLHPVEILPGMWRYPFNEILRLAQRGARTASRPSRVGASAGMASAA